MINSPFALRLTRSRDRSRFDRIAGEISSPSRYCRTTPRRPGKDREGEPLMISSMENSSYSSSTGPKEGSSTGVGEGAREGAWEEQQGEAGVSFEDEEEEESEVDVRECPFVCTGVPFEVPFEVVGRGLSREGSQP